jgi:hypothetical protein
MNNEKMGHICTINLDIVSSLATCEYVNRNEKEHHLSLLHVQLNIILKKMYSTKSFLHEKQESCGKKNLTQRKNKKRERRGETTTPSNDQSATSSRECAPQSLTAINKNRSKNTKPLLSSLSTCKP